MKTTCEICGIEFECRRSTARFCSDRCRIRAFRGKTAVKPSKIELKREFLDENGISAVVSRAHGTVDDLSRASALTPAPVCRSFRNVARKLADALEKEGL